MNAEDFSHRRLLNRSAVRALLLEQYGQWGHAKKRHNVATSVMNDTMEHLEGSVRRFIIGIAGQGFPGRKGGARPKDRRAVI